MCRNYSLFFAIALLVIAISSCNRDSLNTSIADSIANSEKSNEIEIFGVALSRCVANSEDVRSFIKQQAIEKFDNDYDVLYGMVKDFPVNDDGVSFEEELSNYISVKTLRSIEKDYPLLTVYVPDLRWIEEEAFCAEKWDTESNQVAVRCCSRLSDNTLFFDGEALCTPTVGRVPAFPTIVVKNNERVRQAAGTKSGNESYEFISDVYNPKRTSRKVRPSYAKPFNPSISYYFGGDNDNSDYVPASDYSQVAPLAVQAYNTLSAVSGAVQNDYCVFGMTSSNSTGILNTNVRTRLFRFRIPVNGFLALDDEHDSPVESYEDPIVHSVVETDDQQGRHDLSYDELLDRFFTGGNLEINMKVYTESGLCLNKYFDVAPKDILHVKKITKKYWHSTWTKWYQNWEYDLSMNDVEPKWYYPEEHVDLPMWDLPSGSTSRHITFEEVDSDSSVEVNKTYTTKFVASDSTDFDLNNFKLHYGIQSEGSTSNTVKIAYVQDNDDMGDILLTYSDPYISSYANSEDHPDSYCLYSHSTGRISVNFIPVSIVQ